MRTRRNSLLAALAAAAILCLHGSSVAQVTIGPGETFLFDHPDNASCDPASGNGITSGGTCGFDTAENKLLIGTAIALGIAESVEISGRLINGFSVSGTTPRVLDAQVSATVNWNGRLFAGGVAGTGAQVVISLLLKDTTMNSIAGSTTLHSQACQGTILTACERNDFGSISGGFSAKVVRGHSYQLILQGRCSSDSGLIGSNANCLFLPNAVISVFGPANGKISWSELSISIEDDLIGLVQDLSAKLDALQGTVNNINGKVDNLQGSVDIIDARVDLLQQTVDDIHMIAGENSMKLDDTIRLLNTPQGRRSSDFPACEGMECDFPDLFGGNGAGGIMSLALPDALAQCEATIKVCDQLEKESKQLK